MCVLGAALLPGQSVQRPAKDAANFSSASTPRSTRCRNASPFSATKAVTAEVLCDPALLPRHLLLLASHAPLMLLHAVLVPLHPVQHIAHLHWRRRDRVASTAEAPGLQDGSHAIPVGHPVSEICHQVGRRIGSSAVRPSTALGFDCPNSHCSTRESCPLGTLQVSLTSPSPARALRSGGDGAAGSLVPQDQGTCGPRPRIRRPPIVTGARSPRLRRRGRPGGTPI